MASQMKTKSELPTVMQVIDGEVKGYEIRAKQDTGCDAFLCLPELHPHHYRVEPRQSETVGPAVGRAVDEFWHWLVRNPNPSLGVFQAKLAEIISKHCPPSECMMADCPKSSSVFCEEHVIEMYHVPVIDAENEQPLANS